LWQEAAMFVAKQLADAVTWGRALIAVMLFWLGFSAGASGLPWAVALMLLAWTADSVDGALARRSSRRYHTWIGDHDLEVDILVALGLLGYLTLSGWVSPKQAGLYLALWALAFLFFGYVHVLGELVQAPIYGDFVWVAWRHAPSVGWLLPAWMVAAIVVTWPRFPEEKVKGFLQEMAEFLGRASRR